MLSKALLSVLVAISLVQGSRAKQDQPADLIKKADRTSQVNQEATHEIDAYVKNYSTVAKGNDWRIGLGIEEALSYMLKHSKMTDCTFIVGPEGKTEKIEAHSIILSAVSPVFEAALQKNTLVRIKNWEPSDFKKFLSFIYSGDLCFKDFDEACAVMKLAPSLDLDDEAHKAARNYIYSQMYPSNLWNAYLCARDVSDEKLLHMATQYITTTTSAALMDPKFCNLAQKDVSAFVMRDDVKIKSEVEIFEAISRCALKKIAEKGLEATPELMRQTVGTDVLKNIRFLTMSNEEFANITLNTTILTAEESLGVFMFLNSNGSKELLPNTLSTMTEKRTLSNYTEEETFLSFPASSHNCAVEVDFYEKFTTTEVLNRNRLPVEGIQIPKSLSSRSNCSEKEHFDVLILDMNNVVLRNFTYNDVPECTATRFKYINNIVDIKDNNLINVKFSPPVQITAALSDDTRFKIRIVFHDVKEYPRGIESNDNPPNYSPYATIDQLHEFMGQDKVYRTFLSKSFVYSVVMEYSGSRSRS